jgi:metalloendopeptidase OMA1, mitochondrial
MECQEMEGLIFCDDGSYDQSGALGTLCQQLVDVSKDFGRPVSGVSFLKQWFAEAGFVDIEEQIFQLPLNGWMREARQRDLGRYWYENMAGGLQAFSYALLHRGRGMTRNEIEVCRTTASCPAPRTRRDRKAAHDEPADTLYREGWST